MWPPRVLGVMTNTLTHDTIQNDNTEQLLIMSADVNAGWWRVCSQLSPSSQLAFSSSSHLRPFISPKRHHDLKLKWASLTPWYSDKSAVSYLLLFYFPLCRLFSLDPSTLNVTDSPISPRNLLHRSTAAILSAYFAVSLTAGYGLAWMGANELRQGRVSLPIMWAPPHSWRAAAALLDSHWCFQDDWSYSYSLE